VGDAWYNGVVHRTPGSLPLPLPFKVVIGPNRSWVPKGKMLGMTMLPKTGATKDRVKVYLTEVSTWMKAPQIFCHRTIAKESQHNLKFLREKTGSRNEIPKLAVGRFSVRKICIYLFRLKFESISIVLPFESRLIASERRQRLSTQKPLPRGSRKLVFLSLPILPCVRLHPLIY